MGLYDRQYYRESRGGFSLRAPQSVVGKLILVTVAAWIVDSVFFADGHQLEHLLSLKVGTLTKPWLWWQFVTYGFMHSVHPEHIILNMLMLWIFGSEVELVYGGKEFLRIYLATLVVASVAWAVGGRLTGSPAGVSLEGASAAVVGLTVLFVLNYPQRTILFMFVLPMPAWILGVFLVGYNVWGAVANNPSDPVAYSVHLAGAAFALLYFRFRWNLGRFLGDQAWLKALQGQPRLRIHRPDLPEDGADPGQPDLNEPDLGQQVDEILEKIHLHGESSLTRKERRLLEEASRQYQRRRQGK
jgi:membrane associated rhomboid family serine protease